MHLIRRPSGSLLCRLPWLALLVAGHAGASTPPAVALAPVGAQAAYLKRLSLEDLLQLEVTSVSRHAEPFSAAASALTVLTADDVRRSGATTLPMRCVSPPASKWRASTVAPGASRPGASTSTRPTNSS